MEKLHIAQNNFKFTVLSGVWNYRGWTLRLWTGLFYLQLGDTYCDSACSWLLAFLAVGLQVHSWNLITNLIEWRVKILIFLDF